MDRVSLGPKYYLKIPKLSASVRLFKQSTLRQTCMKYYSAQYILEEVTDNLEYKQCHCLRLILIIEI